MTVIVCLDDCLGMLFGGKRQSRDSRILEDIKNHFSPVIITPFSEKLFNASPVEYTVTESVDEASENDTVFLENEDPFKYEDKINKLIIYKWNRKYPSDLKFGIDLSKYKKISICEFVGSSHDKITREVYVK